MIPRRRLEEFVNDADYVTQKNRRDGGRGSKQYQVWMCPFYRKWIALKERTASERFLLKSPTYADVSCCDEWLRFSNFKAWMETQPWEHGKLSLDKDLRIIGNKVYGPEACRFIPAKINTLLSSGNPGTGNFMMGVSFKDSLYHGRCRVQGKLVEKCFKTEKEAHSFFQMTKYTAIVAAVQDWREHPTFDKQIAENLLAVAEKLRYDRAEGRETISYFPPVERT